MDEDEWAYNKAYRIYLEGTYATTEEERDEISDRFISFWRSLDLYGQFNLTATLLDRCYELDTQNALLLKELRLLPDSGKQVTPEETT